MFDRRGILREEAGDGDAGGGVAAAPKPITEEEVGRIVNAAVTSQLKRLNLDSKIADAIASVDLDAKIGDALAKARPAEGEGGEAHEPAKPDPRVAALEAKLADVDKRYEEERKAREAAEEKSRKDSAYNDLRTALQKHVRDGALDIAAKHLFHAEQRISFDDDGRPLFLTKKAQYQGGPEEEVLLPLEDGVQHWIGTNEGKFFAPAPDARAAPGPKGPRAPLGRDGMPQYDGPAKTDDEKIRRAMEREQLLRKQFPNL